MKVLLLAPRRTGPRSQKECAKVPCEKHSARCTMGDHQVRTHSPSKVHENPIRHSALNERFLWLSQLVVTPSEGPNLK